AGGKLNNLNFQKDNDFLLERGKYSAVEISRLLLSYDPHREYFKKDGKMSLITDEVNPTIGNFRLNKMLHICYMLYYSKHGKPLFQESLLAYPRGALVYKILMNFFQLNKEKLTPQQIPVEEEDKKFINKTYCYFKNNSDQELEDFSHSDIS
ncbi:34824_t:CDS:1, partial [Racocetra persica]